MNDKAVKNHDGLCWNCLGNFHPDDIRKIDIPSNQYGGNFDNWDTHVQLCESCIKNTQYAWWQLNKVTCTSGEDGAFLWEKYEYEEQILNFIQKMPLAGQELFYNSCASDGWMEPQDWIDWTQGTMTPEKAKEYGLTLEKYVE